jgi:glyoxylase-like metal-dependent hydrolase (beta-lactamase superfamily II)
MSATMTPATVHDLGGGIHRVTHPLPWALHHVHCYAVAGRDGWTLIDTGLGDDAALLRWRDALATLGSPPIVRILITHHHPDHLGAGAPLAAWTGAVVVQGRIDAAVADAAWRRPEELAEFAAYLTTHGMPADTASRVIRERRQLAVSPAEPTLLLDDGDRIDLAGEPFRVVWLPGHADGHITLLGEHTGRMFGGDVLLEKITPNIGSWPHSKPDPLGAYLTTLRRLGELAPSIVYTGHRRLISDAATRTREIRAHHETRLDATLHALRAGASTAYGVAQRLFGDQLAAHELRFALAEALAHLERLRVTGAVDSPDAGYWVARR